MVLSGAIGSGTILIARSFEGILGAYSNILSNFG